ncbi:MAG: hypothetical protein B6U76_01390 [Desulfurococcales archaeon ex4484_217_2]|nr:MAG: hypothetical protein B6U76_01390 [Desulfurococcales archaeon ex4484_217_2]
MVLFDIAKVFYEAFKEAFETTPSEKRLLKLMDSIKSKIEQKSRTQKLPLNVYVVDGKIFLKSRISKVNIELTREIGDIIVIKHIPRVGTFLSFIQVKHAPRSSTSGVGEDYVGYHGSHANKGQLMFYSGFIERVNNINNVMRGEGLFGFFSLPMLRRVYSPPRGYFYGKRGSIILPVNTLIVEIPLIPKYHWFFFSVKKDNKVVPVFLYSADLWYTLLKDFIPGAPRLHTLEETLLNRLPRLMGFVNNFKPKIDIHRKWFLRYPRVKDVEKWVENSEARGLHIIYNMLRYNMVPFNALVSYCLFYDNHYVLGKAIMSLIRHGISRGRFGRKEKNAKIAIGGNLTFKITDFKDPEDEMGKEDIEIETEGNEKTLIIAFTLKSSEGLIKGPPRTLPELFKSK